MKKIVLLALICSLLILKTKAQEAAKNVPFTFVGFGITVTGTYSQGFREEVVVNGVNILWGAISWGGSTSLKCNPGNSICKIESITSFQLNRTTVNENGQTSFERIGTRDGSTPVLIGEKNGTLTFAIDLSQTAETEKNNYSGGYYILKSPFILGTAIVKKLNLSSETEDKIYVIPAGKYPLYKDGNIYYWTFIPPNK